MVCCNQLHVDNCHNLSCGKEKRIPLQAQTYQGLYNVPGGNDMDFLIEVYCEDCKIHVADVSGIFRENMSNVKFTLIC